MVYSGIYLFVREIYYSKLLVEKGLITYYYFIQNRIRKLSTIQLNYKEKQQQTKPFN